MLLQGQPNQVVQKMVRKRGGHRRIVPIFRFDENGFAEVDETKLNATDVAKLKHLFGKKQAEKIVEQEFTDDEIRDMAKDKGIKSWHTKSIKRLKEEMGV